MKKVEEPSHDVGVLIGRFHINKLHVAHKDLIQSVCNMHKKVILFLGLAHVKGTIENPLDFESRKQMILEDFPNLIILYTKDQKCDKMWSKDLDEKISDLISPRQTVTLYGSRDSFISRYHGRFPTQLLESEVYISASEVRKNISKCVKNTIDWREGAIWQAYNRFPTCFPTVDVAIFNDDYTKLLLGRKPKETKFQFIGGFADPKSPSYEADARREAQEETGLEVSDPIYIGSTLVNDWRYRGETDKIKTLFFKCKMMYGRPAADDDIAEIKWFDFSTLTEDNIAEEHIILLKMLKENMSKV
jgi:bifunctional NMN adenylyltransferase/nudix hydrolase